MLIVDFCRLAEQLEENTDVRKKGMHGFYANLLTKNIAMGGNVENAVSVYTAGSNRQNQIVSDDKQPPVIPSSSNSSAPLESSSSSHAEKVTTEERKVSLSTNPSSTVSKDAVTSAKVSEAAVTTPEVNKAEDINSARERYLARKRKLEAGNV